MEEPTEEMEFISENQKRRFANSQVEIVLLSQNYPKSKQNHQQRLKKHQPFQENQYLRRQLLPEVAEQSTTQSI